MTTKPTQRLAQKGTKNENKNTNTRLTLTGK